MMKWTSSLILVLASGMAAKIANADFTFGTPINLGPTINSASVDWGPSISADGLSLFFGSRRTGGFGPEDIYVVTRATTTDSWEEPMNLGQQVNNSTWQQAPSISTDGLTLFFSGDWSGGYGADDLWVTTRETKENPWNTPVNLGMTVNSSSPDWMPSISADGLSLFFTSNRSGGYGRYDLWVTRRETIHDEWGPPANLGPTVNSPDRELSMSISHDNLLLFFSSDRPGGSGGYDLWVTRRETANDPWGMPVNLGPTVNSSAPYDQTPNISADGSTLYFTSGRPGGIGGGDLWKVSIEPFVDLNGDGIVDAADMCIMVDYWGTDEPLCDIGPMPWGDGIVNVEDLKILAEYLFGDMRCMAHFKLDEAKGSIANDSAGNRDGTVHGGPEWRPTDGVVGGALQLDGVDDYVRAGFVLNPADGALSIFAWIKGGAPGQVILSQRGAANWLSADQSKGNLMTELKASGRGSAKLMSQAVITDGNWHRIGLVWDGSQRMLYVDDVEVAKDTQDNLAGSDNGLYIGAGKAMLSGTYWSGLIDDVRIYNRAVRP